MICGLPLLVMIFLLSHPAFTVSSVAPDATVVLAGHKAVLRCSGSQVTWTHFPMTGGFHEHLYINGNISAQYWHWGFRMAANLNANERNLLIENVTAVVAGEYVGLCTEANGKIEYQEGEDDDEEKLLSSTQLIVLETLPECHVNMDEFVGPNDCSIPLDDIQLSCSVRYSGHKQPTLEWRKSGENEILRSHCVIENDSQFTCNVTLEPSLDFQGSSFTCQTTESSEKKQYSCTTKPIAILHSVNGDLSQRTTLHEGDKVICTANSSQSCTYKWVWYENVGNDFSRTIESTGDLLTAKKIGSHRCEAQCPLRNETCRVFPTYVDVIPSEKNLTGSGQSSSQIQQQLLEKEDKQLTQSVIVLLILGVLPNVASALYLFTRICHKRAPASDRISTSEHEDQKEDV